MRRCWHGLRSFLACRGSVKRNIEPAVTAEQIGYIAIFTAMSPNFASTPRYNRWAFRELTEWK